MFWQHIPLLVQKCKEALSLVVFATVFVNLADRLIDGEAQ